MPRPRKNDTSQPAPDPQLTGTVTPEPEPVAPEPVTKVVTPVATGLPPLAELPEPSQEIFDQPEKPESSGAVSDDGEKWDPAIHETPARKNAKGGWARKRGGARKTSSASHAHAPTVPRPEINSEEMDAKYKSTAGLCAGLIFIAGEMLIGECMKPDADERAGITDAFYECCKAYDITDIPPWLALVGAVGLYAGRRWRDPAFVAVRVKLGSKEKEKDV